MDKINEVIDRITKTFGSDIQDEVTRTTVRSVEGSGEEVENAINDFPKKARHFRDAADYLYSYANI